MADGRRLLGRRPAPRWWRWRWRGCSSGRPADRCATAHRCASPRRIVAVRGRGRGAGGPGEPAIWDSALRPVVGTTGWWWAAGVRRRGRHPAHRPRRGRARCGARSSWPRLASVAVVTFATVAFGAVGVEPGLGPGRPRPGHGPQPRHDRAHHRCAQVVTSILAAYAFAFLRFPCKTLVFAVFMATLLLPLEVTLLANVQTIRELGWINTQRRASSLPFAATAFGTFLIRQGFLGVPPEIQDATRLDGYGHLAFLWRFAVPAHPPGDRLVHGDLGPRGLEPVPVAPGGDRRQPLARRRRSACRASSAPRSPTPTSASPPPCSWRCRSCSCSSPSSARSSEA